MNTDSDNLPPKLLLRFFRWFCHPDLVKYIEGDLIELYEERVRKKGVSNAKWLFAWDVAKLLRPGIIRGSLSGKRRLNHYGMLINYLTASLKSLNKNRFFAGTNVVGLAIAMSAGILMIVLLSEIYSFDNFHEHKDRIYRVTTTRGALFEGEDTYFASASHYIAERIENQIPEVEKVVVLRKGLEADLKTIEKASAVTGYYATNSFFDVFSFELEKGNRKTALDNPGSIILTQSAAVRLFGNANPIGKTVEVESNPDFRIGIITGIIQDPPINSHLQFEMLVSMKTMEHSLVESHRNFKNNPSRYIDSYVYLLLHEEADVQSIESMMAIMMEDYNSRKAPNNLSLEPMSEFVTGGAANQPGASFSKKKISMMLGLTLIVLLSACFNYTNLSFAGALRRFKEMSVRKVIGATRIQIFSQYIIEAVILSFIALVLGIGLFIIIKPEFLNLPNLSGSSESMFLLDIKPVHFLYLLLFTISIGCLAGFLPALFLSKRKAIELFRSRGQLKVFSGFKAREVLITFQFVVSMSLIMCAVIVHKQYKFILNYDLGFETENIINIKIQGDYIDILENDYRAMSEVVTTSRSLLMLGTRNAELGDATADEQHEPVLFSWNHIGPNYLDMHGFELLAGTTFLGSQADSLNQKNIVVNETFLSELKLESPEVAIGKIVQLWGDNSLQWKIQGVVKDFISMSLDTEVPKAFVFMNMGSNQDKILGVKISNNDLFSTLNKLEIRYKKLDPVHPFEASLYNDQIAHTYEDSRAVFTIISFLAFLAISISTLGLLGIAVFNTESRMKEISIRKVLGAELINLLQLLSKSFVIMILIASVIAIPLTLYLIEGSYLSKFLYRTEIGIVEAMSGFGIVLIIGIILVTWQIRVVSSQNAAELLRDE